MKLARFVVVFVLVPILLVACTLSTGGTMTSFTATPGIVCPGATVTLQWEATGTSAEIIPDVGTVPLTGSTTTTVSGPSDAGYTLRIDGADLGTARVNVITPPGESFPVTLNPVCDGARFTGRWSGQIEGLPSEAVVVSVTNNSGQRVNLLHDGIPALNVTYDDVTWTGRPASGFWDATPVNPVLYVCGSEVGTTTSMAPALTIFVVVGCP